LDGTKKRALSARPPKACDEFRTDFIALLRISGPIAAMMEPRDAPRLSMAAIVFSSTPPIAPFQPECAAPITRFSGSTNRIGPQSLP
jgi:hypothetical protein